MKAKIKQKREYPTLDMCDALFILWITISLILLVITLVTGSLYVLYTMIIISCIIPACGLIIFDVYRIGSKIAGKIIYTKHLRQLPLTEEEIQKNFGYSDNPKYEYLKYLKELKASPLYYSEDVDQYTNTLDNEYKKYRKLGK